MAQVISGIITLKQFFNAKESIIGFVEQGVDDEVSGWKLKNNRTYEIPEYQREIKWTEDNVLALVDDINNTSGKFLGNVILSTVNKTKYEIIDGQQRISVLLMILEYIRQNVDDQKNMIDICGFSNKTFVNFYSALINNFSEKGDPQYIEKDLLNQSDTYERLWKYIGTLFTGNNEMLKDFERKLLSARINLLITRVDPHDDEGRRICVDYFIDINNKGKHLDSSDILKAYAFRENYSDMAQHWIDVQVNEKKLTAVHYPKEAMFLHYLMCCVNDNLESNKGIRLKGLSADYEIINDVKINNRIYTKGTKVEELIVGNDFYKQMLLRILKFQEFMQKTISCVGGAPDEHFARYFDAIDGRMNMVSIKNYFKIINGILRNSDIVPKILLMKYFIDIINKEGSKIKDYKALYDIDVVAVVFSAGNGNAKQLSTFARLVMSKNWIKLLHTRAQKALINFPKNIRFAKEVKYINKPTRTSGQFLAHRVCGLSTAYKLSQGRGFEINEQGYNDYLYANLINDEHFIIPQSLKIQFVYRGTPCENYLITLPEKYASGMSYLANYLVIKRDVNDVLKAYNIKEKIRIINELISDGNGDVFADKISWNIFNKVKEIFVDSKCPTQVQINEASSAVEAKKLLENYYLSDDFDNDWSCYVKGIAPEELFSWEVS